MQFLAVFMLTKLIELWFYATDETGTIAWEMTCFQFLQRFFPSFLGYLDGYSDATAVVIASTCHDSFAVQLSLWMCVTYIIGVVFLQWGVLLYLAIQDESQGCLMKLLHMDLLASCITLPPEHKETWKYLALARTFGEDLPQAFLQTLYLLKVKNNHFMILSVLMAVGSSLKAFYDASARRLAGSGVEEEYNDRCKEIEMYSCSQDGTIRVWNIDSGKEIVQIDSGSPANSIAVSNGILYSSHDDDMIRAWSLDTRTVTREFEHLGSNAVVICDAHSIFTWSSHRPGECYYKQWSLDSGECVKQFEAPCIFKASMFVKGANFYATSAHDSSCVSRWSIQSGEVMQTFYGHDGDINAIFATSKRMLTGSQDGTAKEWSLDTGECVRTFPDHNKHFLAPLCVLHDRFYNSSSEVRGQINEWSLISGQKLRSFSGHDCDVLDLTINGSCLFSASADNTIKQWSLEPTSCLRTFLGHTDYINQLVFQFRDSDQ